jgi:hypothetical protein
MVVGRLRLEMKWRRTHTQLEFESSGDFILQLSPNVGGMELNNT